MANARIRQLASLSSLVALAASSAALAGASPASAEGPCTRFAAPGGSDTAAGSETAPYRTAQRLADSLGAGDTGCLREGTYGENVSIRKGGSAGAPVTLRSFPGERAEVVGIFYVAKTAPHVTVEGLYLNGRNPEGQPSPQVNAADTRLPRQRRDKRPHRHLLHPRRAPVRPRHPDADRAQPHPRLRTAARPPTSTTASTWRRRTTFG